MAILINNKKQAQRVSKEHNYSEFWIGRGMANVEYGGSGAGTTVKALKLRNYQRAIGNFVKILSAKDVPVLFNGTESYTDFDHVTIAADISEKNFDVTAGLALHEASHLKYTDKEVLEGLMRDGYSTKLEEIKGLLNLVEDRRIDNIVFKSSPGYKAYYHKLYDHYFRNKEMDRALVMKMDPTYDNYITCLIGLMNKNFNANALPGLPEIMALLDVNNISRLANTAEALELSKKIHAMIHEQVQLEQAAKVQKKTDEDADGEEETTDTQSSQGGSSEGDDSEEQEDSESNDDSESTDGDVEGEPELTPRQEREIQEAIKAAKSLVNGEVNKQKPIRSLQNKLRALQSQDMDYTSVGSGKDKFDCLIVNLHKQAHDVSKLYDLSQKPWRDQTREDRDATSKLRSQLSNVGGQGDRSKEVAEGMQLGAILGRKLLTRREEKSLETNRLRSGKIDVKRIAHAGYGIESIFNQINISKFKKANIHLTIDASGSMGGENWNNTIKLAAALGKAVSMIDGLELQITTRDTDGNNPLVVVLYDSRVNKIQYLSRVLTLAVCNSMTPEGLCLEGLLNKKMLLPTTPECDSYLINICDGSPGFNSYGGIHAINHTKAQVKRLKTELGINHIGFFFGSDQQYGFKQFQMMYGMKESIAIPNASNAMVIADFMNKQLMSR
jgi:hypothetical protein